MSDHLWYYELLDESHGPVSTDEIQEMVADGQLTDDDRIRPESSEEWITVTDLKDLVDRVASGEDEWEEVTDLDDLNFTFEDSSAGVSRAEEVSGEIDDRHLGLDINAFQLTGDPEQARHSAFDSVAGKSTDVSWMVQSLGQVLGPMSTSELVSMAETGALSSSDDVRQEQMEEWSRADSIPEIAPVFAQATLSPSGKNRRSATSADPRRPKSKAGKRPGKLDGSAAGSGPGRKRRRKKKKRSKKDELLAEIFADVFAEDGKVRDITERPDLAKPAAPASTASPAVGMANPSVPVQPVIAGSGIPAPLSPGMGAAGAGGFPGASAGMPGGASQAASHPAFTPPPRKKKRGGGGGAGFSMPEPPVLGAIAGGLLVLLLGFGAYSGWFTVPGFGVDSSQLFSDFEAKFPNMMTKEVPPEKWENFRGSFLSGARSVAKANTKTAGTDPESAKQLNKSLLMIRLLEIPQTATESREATWKKYQEIL